MVPVSPTVLFDGRCRGGRADGGSSGERPAGRSQRGSADSIAGGVRGAPANHQLTANNAVLNTSEVTRCDPSAVTVRPYVAGRIPDGRLTTT